jgi:hypothetical protein
MVWRFIIRKRSGPSALFPRKISNFFGHPKKLSPKEVCIRDDQSYKTGHRSKTVKPPKSRVFPAMRNLRKREESKYLRFRIVAEDASPPRLISHHASSSPPEGLTREQTTASSSATPTSGKAESDGTAGNAPKKPSRRIKKPCRRRNP